MINYDFNMSKYDNYVYYKSLREDKFIYLLLYVDDTLITCPDLTKINKGKEIMQSEFEMKYLKAAKKILGMEITRNKEKKILSIS